MSRDSFRGHGRQPDSAATLSAAYATEGAAIDLGRAVHEGALLADVAVQRAARDDEPPRAGRRRDRHGQDEDAPAARGAALRAPACPCSSPTSRATSPGLAARRRAGRRRREADDRPRAAVRAHGVPGRVPRARRARARACRCARPCRDFGPQLLAKVLEANETQESLARARLPLRRHQGPAAARPAATCARCSRSSTPTRASPSSRGSAGCRRPTVGVLLRSLVGLETGGGTEFFGEPQFDVADLLRIAPDGRGVDLLRRARRGAGEARAVVDRADVARRRAVRGAARGGRPAAAQARRVPRRGAPAVRRRDRGVPRGARAHRAAHPLQGRRRLLRHPAADRPLRGGARPARPAHPARPARVHARRREEAARDGRDLSASPSSTTSRRC